MAGSSCTIRPGAFATLGERFARSMAAWGQEVEALARAEAPVDTGFLASRMFVLVYVDGKLIYGTGQGIPAGLIGRGVELFVGNDAGYGRWVHDGTSDTAPHPFLATAYALLLPRLSAIGR